MLRLRKAGPIIKPNRNLKAPPISIQTRNKWTSQGVLLSSVPLVGLAGWIGYHEIKSLSEDQILFRISRDPQVRADAVAQKIVTAATVWMKAQSDKRALGIKSELSDTITDEELKLEKDQTEQSYYPGALERLGDEHLLPDNHLLWQVHVLQNPIPNAFVSPQGAPRQIFITTGMLNLADTPDELALIVAHELAHILCNHGKYHAVDESLIFGVGIWCLKTPSVLLTAALLLSLQLYDLVVIKRRSRQNEMEADMLALKLAALAGFDTRAASEIFRKIAMYSSTMSGTEWQSTHPPSLARYHYLKEGAKQENREAYGTGMQSDLVTRLSNALWASTVKKNQSWGDRIKVKNVDAKKSNEANPSHDDDDEGVYLLD